MVAEWLLPPIAIQVGLSCLAAQAVLTGVFAVVQPAGPWTKMPALTAHQLVCLPIMACLSYNGFLIWFTQQDELRAGGMQGRVFGVSQSGADMGAMVWGMMLLWDIPVSFMIPTLQDSLMLAHHIGMLFVSGLTMGVFSSGHPIGSYYSPFFFGMVEFSTIFLTIVDLFHPKNKAWHKWLEEDQTSAANFARTVNGICRPIFGLSFLAMRCGLFPYVMFTHCLPDFGKAAMLETDEERHGISSIALFLVCFLGLGFTFLQMNWGRLVVRQLAKALGLMSSSRGKEDGEPKKD